MSMLRHFFVVWDNAYSYVEDRLGLKLEDCLVEDCLQKGIFTLQCNRLFNIEIELNKLNKPDSSIQIS